MNIYQKLAKVQEQIKGLGKDKSSGSGSFSYKYVTGAKVLDNIKPIMIKEGLLLKQEILKVTTERIDYTVYDKNGNEKIKSEILYNVEMLFTWVDTETGDKDENRFFASGMNAFEKGLGSALTYGERYFLLKYFHINTDEDDIDNPERKTEEERERVNKRNKSINYITENGELETIEKAIAHYNKTYEVNGLQDLKDEDLVTVRNRVLSELKKKKVS